MLSIFTPEVLTAVGVVLLLLAIALLTLVYRLYRLTMSMQPPDDGRYKRRLW